MKSAGPEFAIVHNNGPQTIRSENEIFIMFAFIFFVAANLCKHVGSRVCGGQ